MSPKTDTARPRRWIERALDAVEVAGNRLPDPALLFILLLFAVWLASSLLAPVSFSVIDPRNQKPLQVIDQLTGPALAAFLSGMVTTFTSFPPLGVVLVALLGVGVAEHAGLVNTALKAMLSITPRRLLTPALILVAILSHVTGDAGFVVVIPLGGVIFHAAGRHPLAGLAAAFAGVSGGFCANLIPSGIEPLLQGLTQSAVRILDPVREVNPLCNWAFTATSAVIIVLAGWWVTDRIVEPRLAAQPVDPDAEPAVPPARLTAAERRGLIAASTALAVSLALLWWAVWPPQSPLRAPDGSITAFAAPLMKAIVPLIFLLALIPGVAYGYAAGTLTSHRDVIAGMTKAMSTMGYYLVLAFCAALFIGAFTQSNLGVLLALEGASLLRALALPAELTIVGMIILTAMVNLLIGSASAKWALLAPVFVPMLMQLGFAPELIQAAYRIGDSTTNIITPLMPYFPLVVVYCQRYVKRTGIGTLVAIMLPYTATFFTLWVSYLLVYWALGLPLGIAGAYVYP